MYCPRCGQQQLNINSRFCSRCRFLMSGMDKIVEKGGLPKQIVKETNPNALSPRRRGLKQGALLFLSGIVIVPLFAIFLDMINGNEDLAVIAAILTFVLGIVRMVYALFQSGIPTIENESMVSTIKNDLLGANANPSSLPPKQSENVQDAFQPPAGNWRETADLQQANISEKQTKTLHNKTFR